MCTDTKVCKNCQHEFHRGDFAKMSNKRWAAKEFCSRECYDADRADDATLPASKPCEVCGTEIVRADKARMTNERWTKTRFCSRVCADSVRPVPQNPPRKVKERIQVDLDPATIPLVKNCENCGKEFHKKETTSLYEWVTQTKYCSYTCYGIAKRKRTCPECGEKFVSTHGTKQVYCSRQCSAIAHVKEMPRCEWCGEPCKRSDRVFCSPACKNDWYRGENVYNYAGGQARDHYNSAFWLVRAEEIRQRDKVCQRCGKTPEEVGHTLHVHHKTPWAISHDDSPENLCALCNPCHATTDAEWKAANGAAYRANSIAK